MAPAERFFFIDHASRCKIDLSSAGGFILGEIGNSGGRRRTALGVRAILKTL